MQQEYDYSEFAPKAEATKYDYSEFAPKSSPTKGILATAFPSIGILGNVAKDVWNVAKEAPGAIAKGIGDIPNDIDYLKEKVPQALSLIEENPKQAGKAALAGAGEFAGKVSRIPPALADYLAHIGMIKPEEAKAFARPFNEQEVTQGMNKLFGESKEPGADFIRGGIRNLEKIYGGAKLAQLLNPLKYTNKAIIQDVLNAEKKQIGIHNKAYGNLWQQAEKTGFNEVPVDVNELSNHLSKIKPYKAEKEFKSLENFMNDRTLENAQKAQSDMGAIARTLEEQSKRRALLSEEKTMLEAARSAEKHIEENMFKNKAGEVNHKLQKQYGIVTKSYRENVVPYKYNKDIQDYKDQKLLPEELVPKLKVGEFAVKKGAKHPEIGRREKAKVITKLGFGAGALHLLGLDKSIIDRLLGKQ